MRDRTPARAISIDHDEFDCAMTLKVWDEGHTDYSEIRVAVEDIPSFMDSVVRHGGYALSTAARRLEVGHCETCANTGLVDAVGPAGQPTNKECPDCRDRWPAEPFKNAPHIGRRAKS